MAPAPLLSISDNKKLETLRRLDQFRNWRFLDDKRYCLCCAKIITGYEIQITPSDDSMQINCPTLGCDSIPMDWVLPTDEVLSAMSMLGEKRAEVAAAPRPLPGWGNIIRQVY